MMLQEEATFFIGRYCGRVNLFLFRIFRYFEAASVVKLDVRTVDATHGTNSMIAV